MKAITWITPTFFIDVDYQIVPYLANTYKIHWIIIGCSNKPSSYYNLNKMPKNDNLKLEYYSIDGKWYFPNQYLKYKKLFNYAKSFNSDIIYINSSLAFWIYYAAIHTLPKNKTVLATHNVKTPKGARLENFVRYYMYQTLKYFNNFHVFSKNQKNYLNSLTQNKNILYAPLTLKDYGPKGIRSKYEDRINFLSFGHIRNYKRIDLLIIAAQELYEEIQIPFIVTIAGNCKNWEEYQKLIKNPNIFDVNIGFINDENVSSYFDNADYLILPYQDLAQSGAITVAFNYHVPVIASDIIQFQEFIIEGTNGFLFQTESIESLKQTMKKAILLGKGKNYQDLINNCKDFVSKNYVLSTIANKYIEYFNKI